MKKIKDILILSAADLANHIACRHLTYLNTELATGKLTTPEYYDPTLEIMQERGLAFEQAYLESLRTAGLIISEPDPEQPGEQRTLNAMQAGADIIYQASLRNENWEGRADFLKKVDKSSDLGNWSYEVIDSKLAKDTRAGTILQLCLYSQMIEKIQGVLPEYMHVITPENEFTCHEYRVNDFMAYHRLVQRLLEDALKKGIKNDETYPDPVAHCDICRWWQYCNKQRREDDHLSFVAGLSGRNVTEINKWDIETLERFAKIPLPLEQKPSRGSVETYERLREQARVQFDSRGKALPVYEMLIVNQETGLSRLPEPSEGDIFFDFESDPFAGNTGIEYLFGWVFAGDDNYHRYWALKSADEKKAFEDFVDTVMARWRHFPDLHIYHYTAYEPSALKRLMGKYATRENEIDTMLRAGIFIDLYSITKQALRAGIERYSLKELEIFHAFKREMELRSAALQLRVMEMLLERNQIADIPARLISGIEQYNKEDCLSTKSLRTWLEGLRVKLIADGHVVTRPQIQRGDASEAITEHQQRIQPLYEALAVDISANRSERDQEQNARWLLANMLDWYRREKKAAWWEYYRLLELPADELLEEKNAISGLIFTGQRREIKKSVIDRYQFPVQECDIRSGDDLKAGDGASVGQVTSIDIESGYIDIKKGPSKKDIHPLSVFKQSIINDKVKEEAIIRIAEWVANNGISVNGSYRAGRDLLLGLKPRTKSVFNNTGNPQDVAVVWINVLEDGVLPIQGPPGAGKSHTASRMILELVRQGKKVGIAALSHKVIRGLLEKVVKVAVDNKIVLSCIEKVGDVSVVSNPLINETEENDAVLSALQSGQVQVAAGTAWLWAREEFFEAVDVLFVDEAGQLSLIDTLAVSQAAKNIVLLGDPQQLKQPVQGSHPEGTEVSALEHMLGDHKTIPVERGIFLNETWRMHPDICAFISELFYEGRLQSRPELSWQRIDGNTKFKGAGLWFEPVVHQGNQSTSAEEVGCVANIVGELTAGGVKWTNSKNETKTVTLNDIMVIAPYNAQVSALIAGLPVGTHVGTVDKFQGQEAPVVIFSMATSKPEDAPRGMEFLYSLNRLNVAVSRARAVSILVACPNLFEPDCKTPQQMKLANAFCRYLEMSC